MFNEVQAGRFGRLIQRLTNIKGSGSPAPQLAGDIESGITLESDREEWAFLAGDKLCTGSTDLAAAPGFMSEAKIGNPLSSGILVIVDAIAVGVQATTLIRTGYTTTLPAAGANNGVPRDSRWFRTPASIAGQSAALFSGTNNAGTTLTLQNGNYRLLLNDTRVLPVRMMLHQGFAWLVDPGQANWALTCTMFWRERALEQSELNPLGT